MTKHIQILKEKVTRIVDEAKSSDAAYIEASDLLEAASLQGLPPLQIAILRSFTIEPLIEVLRVKVFLEGYRLELFINEFNQYEQEILDSASRLYAFKADVVFIAVRLEELCPHFFHSFSSLGEKELEDLQGYILKKMLGWIEQMREKNIRNIVLSNFLVPSALAQGLYDTQNVRGQVAWVRTLNQKLLELKERYSELTLLDVEHLAARVGKESFCDSLQFYRMSNPYSLSAYVPYGEFLLTHIRALLGRARKCLVLDLDDTLWGGLVGEEGVSGIILSDTFPGNTFKDFQKAVLNLYHRGVVLAINSKNNHEEAMTVIRSHPDMILREEHFSAIRINWNDKAENLSSIVQELKIGLDAFVFVDDSPVECARIRQAYPQVLVVQLPQQRHRYRETIERLSCFERLTITEEDRKRGQMYRQESQRTLAVSQAATLEEFYAELQMRGTLFRNDVSCIPRIAQMTQKINQFNLTTRRYAQADIERFMEQGTVYALGIEDRYGDNGVVAVAIVQPAQFDKGTWVIDSFLMSCRVIMRTIEDTLLATIVQDARSSRVSKLVGFFVPSPRNKMVQNFYGHRGFTAGHGDSSEKEYHLILENKDGPEPSKWIQLKNRVNSLQRMGQT
jgi:FkbH-like protein